VQAGRQNLKKSQMMMGSAQDPLIGPMNWNAKPAPHPISVIPTPFGVVALRPWGRGYGRIAALNHLYNINQKKQVRIEFPHFL